MLKISFLNSKPLYTVALLGTVVFLIYGFSWMFDKHETITWGNQCLSRSYDYSGEPKLKKWELLFTTDAFFRLRKTYQSGRQEYFSFKLSRFKDMDYLGNNIRGTLRLKTLADDIIVQTYNDPKGNVDSMTTQLSIPVKNMEADQLDSLYKALNYLKK
jgi:hypothetical protein